MIQASGITKSYGDLQVLKGIELEIKAGEIVSVVGASGAGKTTLLHILGTLDKPDQGSVTVNNTLISDMNDKKLAAFRNKNIGFVFQFHHLLPEFTALENVMIPGFIGKRPKGELKKEAERYLEMLGLANRGNHKPSQLSGGEQQRVAVARALINKPAVVMADEPSGNLDTATSKTLHQLFFDLRDELGHTFVIVTHNNELADMADRKIEMKDGNIML